MKDPVSKELDSIPKERYLRLSLISTCIHKTCTGTPHKHVRTYPYALQKRKRSHRPIPLRDTDANIPSGTLATWIQQYMGKIICHLWVGLRLAGMQGWFSRCKSINPWSTSTLGKQDIHSVVQHPSLMESQWHSRKGLCHNRTLRKTPQLTL